MPASQEPSLVLTILYVQDLPKAVAFYDQVFSWKKTVNEPVYVEFELGHGARIGLMPQTHTRTFLGIELGAKQPTDGAPRAEVYLQFENVAETVNRLEESGGQCVSRLADRDWGDRAAYYVDLDGYVLAVAEPLHKL